MSQLLHSKISAVRAKHFSVAIGTGAALAIVAVIAALAIGMLLDWWLDLPRFIRAAFLAVDLAAVAIIVLYEIFLPIARSPDDDQVALHVEEAHPEFRSRLIAAIQLSRPQAVPVGASTSLVTATIAQAEAMAGKVNFTRVIKTDRLRKWLVLAVVMLVGGSVAFAVGRRERVTPDLLARAFLSNTPVPRKTRIEITTGFNKLGRGDTAALSAKASGTIPPGGTVDIKFESGRKQSFPLDVSPTDATVFVRPLENVQDSFSYRIHLGDNTTAWQRIDVLNPPVVTHLECQQIFPAYTKRGTVSRSLGDLSILSGSKLLLSVTSNNPLQSDGPDTNVVHLVHPTGLPGVAMVIDPADPHHASAEVAIPAKTQGFSIKLRDTDGLQSKEPAVYRIDLVADKDPTVQISFPEQKEELVTRMATLDIGFDAADDYGIAKLSLKYKIDDGDIQTIPLEVAKPGQPLPRTLHRHYTWKISTLTPRSTTQPTLEGSNIEYWLEAEDNNNVTGPGEAESEHFSARVVSELEKRKEIFARLGAFNQDVERGIDDQDTLRKNLGAIILERKPEPGNP